MTTYKGLKNQSNSFLIDEQNLKKKTLIPIFIVLILLLCISVIIIYYQQREHVNQEIEKKIVSSSVLFSDLVVKEANFISEKIRTLSYDDALIELWKEKDRKAIIEHISPFYNEIKEANKITNLSFADNDKICMLRMHQLLLFNDTIRSASLDSTEYNSKGFYGIEFDTEGKLLLKIVRPWKYQDESLGYIIAAIPAEYLIDEIRHVLQTEIILTVDNKFIKKDWLDINKNYISNLKWNSCVIKHTLGQLPDLNKIMLLLNDNKEYFKTSISNNFFICGLIPYQITSRENVGNIIVLNNITDQNKALNKILTILISIAIVIGALLIIFFYLYVSRIQKSIVHAAKTLKNSEIRFRRLFEQSFDPFIIMDENKIIDCNKAFVKLLEYKSKDELLAKKPSELSPDKQPDGHLSSEKGSEMLNLARENGFHRFEWLHKKADGKLFYVDVTITVIYYDIKEEPIFYIVWHDIDKLKRKEFELTEERDSAELANFEKTEFLINMNHELITPLNAIMGLNNLMLKTNLTGKQREFSEMIKTSALLINSIIKDLHEFDKIKLDQIKIENHIFNLPILLLSISDAYEYKSRKNNLGFNNNIEKELPSYLISDPVQLRHLLFILLENAIKHTQKGEINFSAFILGQTDEYIDINFEVSDTGEGIPENKMSTLFDLSFYNNVDNEKFFHDHIPGLIVAKHIIELLNGKIEVKSKKGKGSTFNIQIRLKKANETEINEFNAIEKSIKIEVTKNPLNILVVEDNKINQEFIKVVLESYGHKVHQVYNGNEAESILNEQVFDCILMDIEIPGMNGVEVTKKVKDNTKNPNYNTPIIAVTANTMAGDKDRYLKAGLDYYIPKPVNEHLLYNVLSKIMK